MLKDGVGVSLLVKLMPVVLLSNTSNNTGTAGGCLHATSHTNNNKQPK